MIEKTRQINRESQGGLSVNVLQIVSKLNIKKRKKSQHDKHQRLNRRNTNRKKTRHATVPLTGAMHKAVLLLRAVLDKRMAFRLSIIVAGMFLADGRQYKTFLATSRLVRGEIRVVIIRFEDGGWVPCFCTATSPFNMSLGTIIK